ncbi:SPFH domain-containing protein [Nocardiopsis sp. CA-288880]|uniref:SPFH domain-containing protein n=1 Tax=Nocardiopsis sp. CA-288880 TaxID=3239995 RepID=UPI003D997B09
MEQFSYDPVLRQEEIQPFRLFKPIQPPEHGTAMVLEPQRGDALLVRPGEPVPDARFGVYQRMSLVDTTEHRLAFAVTLVSRDPSFGFRAAVTLSCRVADPVAVVQRGIRDMAPTLRGPLRGMLREVSRRYDISEFHEGEQALNEAVGSFHGDSAIRLRRIVVELQLDEDEITTGGRAYRDKLREQRLDSMGRSYNLRLLREEGPEALIAGMLEKEGDRAVLEWIRSEETADRAELMRALEVVMEHNEGEREPFDTAEIERTIVDRLVDSRSRTTGGIGRVRGTRGGAALPEPVRPRELGGAPDEPERTVRAEFEGPAPSGPPEDEPLPAAGTPPEEEPPARPRGPGGSPRAGTDRGDGRPRTSRVRGLRPEGGGRG